MTFIMAPLNPSWDHLAFADKFSDEIKDKKQLQRFLRYLNYVSDFFPNLRRLCETLHKRLSKNPVPWTDERTKMVRQVKERVKCVSCLGILNTFASMIVETGASHIGYGGILKQKLESRLNEQLVRFHSGLWLGSQQNYSAIKKKYYLLYISKF